MKRPRLSVGDRFGHWTLVRFVGGLRWRAECACGGEYNVNVEDLTSGRSTQCHQCWPKEPLPEPEPKKAPEPKEILPRAGTPMYTHNGRTMTIPEWCKATGIKPVTLRQRLARGWSFADAISVKNARGTRKYQYKEG